MSSWTLNPEYVVGPTGSAFASLRAVFALDEERIARDRLSEVLRVQLGTRHYHVKRFDGASKPLRRFVDRRSMRSEWRNLLYLQAWGIPVATVVGYGMETRGGVFRGALITEELRDTHDLADLACCGDSRLLNPRWVDHVLRQVALAARTMHGHGFAHMDLQWRNILVDDLPLPNIHLSGCSGATFPLGPFLERSKIKDLACLDKLGRHHLSRSQRLRFYLRYRGQQRLTRDDRRQLKSILRCFEGCE